MAKYVMLLEITFEWTSRLESFGCDSFHLFGASSLTSPLHFGLYIFLWCSYTELILKWKGRWGTVHHSVGSRSLKETSVLQEEGFCNKAQSGSMVIRLLNETLNKWQKSEAVKWCGIPMMSFPKQIQVRIATSYDCSVPVCTSVETGSCN